MKRPALFTCLVIILIMVTVGTVLAQTTVASVSPSSGPNEGTITLVVTGSGLDTATEVRLNKCKLKTGGSSQPPFDGVVIKKTATMIIVQFDLTGKIVGDYDLSVNAPKDEYDQDWGVGDGIFSIYQAGKTTPTTTTTTTTAVTTTRKASTGDNTVYFETSPSGADIYVDGDEVGTSTFIFYTSMDGVHDVLVKKIGYEDYSDRVTIVENSRVRFYAELTPLASTGTPSVTGSQPGANSGTPVKAATTNRRSTLKVPTPLGTFAPYAEESPADPAIVLFAAGIGALFVVLRRK